MKSSKVLFFGHVALQNTLHRTHSRTLSQSHPLSKTNFEFSIGTAATRPTRTCCRCTLCPSPLCATRGTRRSTNFRTSIRCRRSFSTRSTTPTPTSSSALSSVLPRRCRDVLSNLERERERARPYSIRACPFGSREDCDLSFSKSAAGHDHTSLRTIDTFQARPRAPARRSSRNSPSSACSTTESQTRGRGALSRPALSFASKKKAQTFLRHCVKMEGFRRKVKNTPEVSFIPVAM